MGRGRVETLLNVGTAAVVAAAVAHLFVSRVLPAWSAVERLDEGDRLAEPLGFRTLVDGTPLRFEGRGPALLLVYQSTCPACRSNVPAWREVLDARDPSVRIYAVALEPDAPGLRFARRYLPEALAVRPDDGRRFAALFDLQAVPTTVFLDAVGRLSFRSSGHLTRPDVEALLSLVGRAHGPP